MNYNGFKQASKKRVLLTKEGLDNLKKKLDRMTARRHTIVKELRSIRDADTDVFSIIAHIQKLERIEKEAAELDELLQYVEPVIKPEAVEAVALGCTVGLKSSDKLAYYTIVCSLEIDIENNKISADSALGKAVLGKKIGELFSITTPKGLSIAYEVASIN